MMALTHLQRRGRGVQSAPTSPGLPSNTRACVICVSAGLASFVPESSLIAAWRLGTLPEIAVHARSKRLAKRAVSCLAEPPVDLKALARDALTLVGCQE
jgi:hypothetical protein